MPDDPSCWPDLVPIDDDKMGNDDHDMDHMEKMSRMDGKMTWDDVDAQLEEWIPGQPGGAFRNAIFMTAVTAAGAGVEMFRY